MIPGTRLGAAAAPAREYVVTLDDSLAGGLVQREERHYTGPSLSAEDALALASTLTATAVSRTGKWLLPMAGGQTIVALQDAAAVRSPR